MNEVAIVNSTARSTGAVGSKAITPKYVGETSSKSDTVLDYGAGRNPMHTRGLREQGLDVTAYDIGANVVEGLHDAGALNRTYDTVFASNVLNVAPTELFLRNTLSELKRSTKNTGRVVFNYPASPRKLPLTATQMEDIIREYFPSIRRVGGTGQAPLWEAKQSVVIDFDDIWNNKTLNTRRTPNLHKPRHKTTASAAIGELR